jgi:hypothetical protein
MSQDNLPAVSSTDVAALEDADAFRQYLLRRAQGEDLTDEQRRARNWLITAQQMSKIFSAPDEEVDTADMGGTIGGREFENVEFEIQSFDVSETTENDEYGEAPLGVFALIRGVALQDDRANNLKVGDPIILNTGAPLVIAKVRSWEQREMFPLPAVIRGTKSKAGRVLRIERAPERVSQKLTKGEVVK